MRAPRPGQEYVAQGQELRQRAHGGVLRDSPGAKSSTEGLVGLGAGRLHGRGRPLDAAVPRGAPLAGPGLAHARRAPRGAGLRRLGCTRKRQQSPTTSSNSSQNTCACSSSLGGQSVTRQQPESESSQQTTGNQSRVPFKLLTRTHIESELSVKSLRIESTLLF